MKVALTWHGIDHSLACGEWKTFVMKMLTLIMLLITIKGRCSRNVPLSRISDNIYGFNTNLKNFVGNRRSVCFETYYGQRGKFVFFSFLMEITNFVTP